MAKVLRPPSPPVASDGGGEAVFGDGAITLGGIGGGAGAPTGGGGGDAAEAGGADGAPGTGSAGAADRFMAKVLRLPSPPVASDGGAEAVFGDGAIGRAVGADLTGGVASLAKVDRL